MGRKKIKIARIADDRNRSVTYLKRKAGLMKKAHELAVLTSSDVAVIVFGQNGKLSEFCSGDIDRILLRYTEHTGPVEHKGPEHYQNDDDDGSDDDNMGDGGDDGEGSSGDGAAGGSSTAGRHGGAGASKNGSRRSSAANGSNGADSSNRAPKRKAPGNHVADAGSSRDASPIAGAPIIKVEDEAESDAFADDGSLDKGQLKAAILQNSIRKPRSNSHHGGRPTSSRSQGYSHHHTRSEQDIHSPGLAAPQAQASNRPNTADMMRGPNAFVFPAQQTQVPQSNQQPTSPSPFAFGSESSAMQSGFNGQQGFLGPQGWQATLSPGQPSVPPQPSNLHPDTAVSYGDLARGGSVSSAGLSPMSSQHLQPSLTPQSLSPSPLPSPEVQALGHSAAYADNNGNLLPLAHPILRDHPQYEAYAARFRQQQQQVQAPSLHHRNASMPAFPTAQTIGNFLAAPSTSSPMNPGSPAASAPPHSPAGSAISFDGGLAEKRSASFGNYSEQNASGGPGRYVHQTSLSDLGPMTSNGFLDPHSAERRNDVASASQYAPSRPTSGMSTHSHHSHHSMSGQAQPSPSAHDNDYASLASGMGSASSVQSAPPPYGTSDMNDTQMSNDPMQSSAEGGHLSNAAFNDLMGSILGDMSGTDSNQQAMHASMGPSSTPLVSEAQMSSGLTPGFIDVKVEHYTSSSGAGTTTRTTATGHY